MKGCGCPCRDMNWETLNEICTLTGEPTNGAMKCDFGYDEDCAEYKKQTSCKEKKKQ